MRPDERTTQGSKQTGLAKKKVSVSPIQGSFRSDVRHTFFLQFYFLLSVSKKFNYHSLAYILLLRNTCRRFSRPLIEVGFEIVVGRVTVSANRFMKAYFVFNRIV